MLSEIPCLTTEFKIGQDCDAEEKVKPIWEEPYFSFHDDF